MLKNVSQLKITIDNKDFMFYCDPDSPLATCKEALFQFQKYVGQIEDAAKKMQEETKIAESQPEVDLSPVCEEKCIAQE